MANKSTLDSPLEQQLAWVKSHSRQIGVGVGIAIGLVLAVFLYTRSNQLRNTRAELAYAEAQQLMYSGNRAQSLVRLNDVVNRYAGTNIGSVAAMRLALVHLEERKIADAIEVLRKGQAKANDKIFAASFHGLIAAALSDSGVYADAAEEYLKAAEAAALDSEKDSYRYRAAEAYTLANNRERALKIIEQVTEGPPSETRARARKLHGELLSTPSKAG